MASHRLAVMKRVLFVLLAACATPAETPPATPAASASAREAVPTEAHRPRKPIEIASACPDVVTVVFGEDPKSANATSKTIAPMSSVEGLRDVDGNVTIWLLDTAAEPLLKVHVTRGMKKVEVGRSCRTLDAR